MWPLSEIFFVRTDNDVDADDNGGLFSTQIDDRLQSLFKARDQYYKTIFAVIELL